MNSTAFDLISLLEAILSGRGSEKEINSLVRIAHRLALIRLQQLVHSGRLHLQSFPLSLDAAAFDCIAELFQRNEEGRFVELEEYYADQRSPSEMSEEDAHHYFRVLVFSKLNDGIFRLYRDNDPILSKILRNLKSAVKRIDGIREFSRLGIAYFFSCEENERNDHLPEMPMEELESLLGSLLDDRDNSLHYLQKAFEVLNTQEHYRRFYPLISLAVVVKRLSVRRRIPIGNIFNIDDELFKNDILNAVTTSVEEAEKILNARYVEAGKISSDYFEKCFSAIQEMLHDIYVANDGVAQSHAEYFLKHHAEIKYDDYRNRHRIQFEYMVKLAKKEVQERLKELL